MKRNKADTASLSARVAGLEPGGTIPHLTNADRVKAVAAAKALKGAGAVQFDVTSRKETDGTFTVFRLR